MKVLLSTSGGHCTANLTRTDGQILVRGEIAGLPAEASLILNARVEMPPQALEDILRAAILRASGTRIAARIENLKSLSPGRPRPTHRHSSTVEG